MSRPLQATSAWAQLARRVPAESERPPGGFHLMMAQAAQEDVLVAAIETGQRAAQRVLRPALRIGLLGVDEEAVVSLEQAGNKIGEVVVLG